MRTVALSEHTATRLAYRQYLGLLAEDDRGFRQAFRTAFFRAMREQLTPRQYEVLWMIERWRDYPANSALNGLGSVHRRYRGTVLAAKSGCGRCLRTIWS